MKSKKRLMHSTPEGTTAPKNPNEAYSAFAKKLRETKEGRPQTDFLHDTYETCFKNKVPAGISEELIKTKISYHLLVVEGYQKCNVPVPTKVMQNYKASQELNIEGFSGTTQAILKLKKKEGDETMAKKTVKVVRKASSTAAKTAKVEKKASEPRVTVSGIFAGIFAANYSKKLTDEQIVKEVNSQAKGIGRGHTYNVKDVPVVRRKFNLGLLVGQTSKPKTELVKFEAKK